VAEGNGSERDARLNRIEQEHDEFRRDMKNLLIAQVIQKSEIDDLLKLTREQTRQLELESTARREKDEALDARVDKLVSSIGELISRIPPENLRGQP
jgi:hypothetical protein